MVSDAWIFATREGGFLELITTVIFTKNVDTILHRADPLHRHDDSLHITYKHGVGVSLTRVVLVVTRRIVDIHHRLGLISRSLLLDDGGVEGPTSNGIRKCLPEDVVSIPILRMEDDRN